MSHAVRSDWLLATSIKPVLVIPLTRSCGPTRALTAVRPLCHRPSVWDREHVNFESVSGGQPTDGDWRLTDQKTYFGGASLRFARWTPYRRDWDHDHCKFCFAEISDDTAGHAAYNEAWVTADDRYIWVCPPCFTDFRDPFHWVVAEA